MKVGHKIRLNPTPEQEKYFIQACNAARIAYNWGLAEWNRMYKAGDKPNVNKVKKRFNAIKRESYPWVCKVTKCATEGALRDLGTAFSNWFKNRDHFGRPRFKKKGNCKESFYLANDKFTLSGHRIKVPKLGKYTGNQKLSWVNMAEAVRFKGHILSGRISRQAGKWYISINVEIPHNSKPHQRVGTAVGVDLGISHLATLSTGEVIENLNASDHQSLLKLKRLNRELSRRQEGSTYWRETLDKIQRLHLRIANQRRDHIHKMTTYLTSEFEFIALEDLNVAGLLKNHRLAMSISDASWAEIVRQIEYKASQYGGKVQKVDRFFPSSRICSKCGHRNSELKLKDRTYVCINPHCGIIIDRDLNAALNILKEGLSLSL